MGFSRDTCRIHVCVYDDATPLSKEHLHTLYVNVLLTGVLHRQYAGLQ